MKNLFSWLIIVCLLLISGCGSQLEIESAADDNEEFTFVVTADMQWRNGPKNDTPWHLRGACEAIAEVGRGDFMISAGDVNPAYDVRWTIDKYIGKDYIWYPAVGNHDIDKEPWIQWLRDYNLDGKTLPNIVNMGPEHCKETMYSFDWGNCHFAIINMYCDANSDTGGYPKGTFRNVAHEWLKEDLTLTDKQHIFVCGHEPAYRQRDMDSGIERGKEDKGQNSEFTDRFWDLLNQKDVLAYICGHMHSYKVKKFENVWQIQCGHCRGKFKTESKYADKDKSTFMKIYVDGNNVTFDTYRLDAETLRYKLEHRGSLTGSKIKVKAF